MTPEKQAEWECVVEAFQGKDLGRGWKRASCPNCVSDGHDDYKQSLGYLHETGGYCCFKCEMSGRLPASYRERIADEAEFQAAALVAAAPTTPLNPADGYIPAFVGEGATHPSFEWVRAYMVRRGIDEATCRAAQIGGALWGRLTGRVIMPILNYHDPSQPWRGWVARHVLDSPWPMLNRLPYLNAKGMDREHMLYNEPALYVQTTQPLYVVEGPMDTLALWPDVVGLLGKPTGGQRELLCRARRPLAICLDADAWETGQALAWTLEMYGLRVVNLRLPPGDDPNTLGRAGVAALYAATRCVP